MSAVRKGQRRPDGSMELATQIDKQLIDLERFERFTHGEDFIAIANTDGISAEQAKNSVRKGMAMFEAQQQIILKSKKYEAAIENEEIRAEVRKRVQKKLVDAIDTLLEGKRTVVEVNKATGEVTMHEITDPEMIAMGIEAARKTISLEEKPVANQTFVNIQQNNMGDNASVGGSMGLSYEERLERIQREQGGSNELPALERVIDVIPEVTEEQAPEEREEDQF